MKITHRIPWRQPYGYTEIEYEYDESPDPAGLLEAAIREAVDAENVWQIAASPLTDGTPGDEEPRDDDGRQTYARPPASRPHTRPQSQGSGVWCPEHSAECFKTKAEYDRHGDRWYHPLDARDQYRMDDGRLVKNHNLYWRQTVDADGESNADRAMPSRR